MKTRLLFLLLLLALALPGLALADTITPGGGRDTWQFYAFGNGFVMWRILEALKMMTASGAFITLAIVMAMVGLMVAAWLGLIGGRPSRLATYLGALIIGVYVIFSVKVDIFIEDMVHAQGSPRFEMVVTDVPAAIGLPMAVVSEIGMWATRSIETNMRPASDTQLPMLSQGFPAGVAQSLVKDMTTIRIGDAGLRAAFEHYFFDCVMGDIYVGRIDPQALITTNDTWAMMRVDSPSRYTEVPFVPDYGGVMSCQEAYPVITERLQEVAPRLLESSASTLWNPSMAGADALSGLVGFVTAGGTTDAAGMAIQAGVLEMLSGAYEYAASATGSTPLMTALHIEQAKRAQKSGWMITATLFQDMAGYFFAVLQAFVFGLAPLILLAMFLPGLGAKIGGTYGKVIVWLMLWWPGLAIMNAVMLLFYENSVGGLLQAGLTGANIGLVSSYTDNMMMASGFVMTLVPALMWAIVSGGGMAFTSVLDRASGAGYASQAAGASSAGNLSMGSISLNNTAMNAHQTSHRNSFGSEPTFAHDGLAGIDTRHIGGSALTVAGHQQSVTTSLAESRALQQAQSEMTTATQEFRQQIGSDLSFAYDRMHQLGQNATIGEDGSLRFSSREQEEQFNRATELARVLEGKAQQLGVSNEEITNRRHTAGIGSSGSGGTGSGRGGLAGVLSSTLNSRAELGTESRTGEGSSIDRKTSAETGHTSEGGAGFTRGQGSEVAAARNFATQDMASLYEAAGMSDRYGVTNSTANSVVTAQSGVDEAARAYSASRNVAMVGGMTATERQGHLAEHSSLSGQVDGEIASRGAELGARSADVQGTVSGNVDSGRARVNEDGGSVREGAGARFAEAGAGVAGMQGLAGDGAGMSNVDRMAFNTADRANTARVEAWAGNGPEGFNAGDLRPIELPSGATLEVAGVTADGSGRIVYAHGDAYVANAGDGEMEVIGQYVSRDGWRGYEGQDFARIEDLEKHGRILAGRR